MHHHVTEVKHEPAFARLSLYTAFFLVIFPGRFHHAFGKRVKHAVTGSIADDEVIGKRCNILDIKKEDVFTLFVLQGVDDYMCKI